VVAHLLLEQAGLAEQGHALVGSLLECAWQLARVACAVAPANRSHWALNARQVLSQSLPLLALEEAAQRIALAWVAASGYASDALWQAELDALIVVPGELPDPLVDALLARHAAHAVEWPMWPEPGVGAVQVHPAQDADDEAQRCAACVMAHVNAGRVPVALVAQDRSLTRQVRAQLGLHGVGVRDETGWKLSTTRAAARLMRLLQALEPQASSDTVLDALKNCPAVDAKDLAALERQMQLHRQRSDAGDSASAVSGPLARRALDAARQDLQSARPLDHWRAGLRDLMAVLGLLDLMQADEAGVAVLQALQLDHGGAPSWPAWPRPIAWAEFQLWVDQTLEAGYFVPVEADEAPVVILPLAHVPLRPFAAAVVPGCDELHLDANPAPPGGWTSAQRAYLGLASVEDLASKRRAAWHATLGLPQVDLLWRQSDQGEARAPSPLVQLWLQGLAVVPPTPDYRVWRDLSPQPVRRPTPAAPDLLPQRLSASAYEDLRRCPYRFFALRQLRLAEEPELDADLGPREFGSWLHAVLHRFHQQLALQPDADRQQRSSLMEQAAQQVSAVAAASAAWPPEWLAFEAAWPQLREGYLQWLEQHEAQGFRYEASERRAEQGLDAWTLVGQIDRVDRQPDGLRVVLDYKTEPMQRSADRVKAPLEDTQIVFYAALLDDDELACAYVNVSEKEGTRSHWQTQVVAARDELLQGLQNDLTRIAAGAPLLALGEGEACEFCTARGLCRKDYWEAA